MAAEIQAALNGEPESNKPHPSSPGWPVLHCSAAASGRLVVLGALGGVAPHGISGLLG